MKTSLIEFWRPTGELSYFKLVPRALLSSEFDLI